MNLFAAAGISMGDGGRGGRSGRSALSRTFKIPLLNKKVVDEALRRFTFDLTPQQITAAENYAKNAKTVRFRSQKETAVRPVFIEKILHEILGYEPIGPEGAYSLAFEHPIRSGAVDTALGRFGVADGGDEILAPFELKGPSTTDLDAIMPGRGRSPVQQAWDYAIDAPTSRWVLVSNCIEIRLYGFGRGREAFEQFDLTRLDERDELERLWFILSAGRFLGGNTEALLRDSDNTFKSITDTLYGEYSKLRGQLVQFLTDSVDGPKLSAFPAIELTQKLLDRILFIAFAQGTGLVRRDLLEIAATTENKLDPQPLWNNFRNLFRHMDVGYVSLGISDFNGGLFAPDPVADAVTLPNYLTEQIVSLGKWDYGSDVPVTVLGHIFEQSITDLEKMRADARGEEAPKVTKRKREGVVYTPDIVTHFLVERTIRLTLSETLNGALAEHGKAPVTRGSREDIFKPGEEKTERAVWGKYLAALRDLTIVDPACGSGAFLVAAFDVLAGEYRRVVERLATLGEPIDFDPFDEIVTKNLFGVDLNAESVEITRLALWLKTARDKHRLQNLEANIKVGDSLIDDKKFTDRPFDWRAAFPQVFARDGFDIVVGNPPYVRMELIKPVKPYLEKHYIVADDRTDLYAYFFERGVRILKDGGRLGYISSSTFFRTGSGEKLRTFLGDQVAVETVIDFGDLQLFEGVTTYPAIITLQKGKPGDDGDLKFLKIDDALPSDLDAVFTAGATSMPRARLGAGSWQFEGDALARLRDKIVKGRKTLGEVYGAPLRGIVTGLNEAFIIDTPTRDRLVKQDKKSAKLLKPFLRGENVKRWRVESEGLYFINIPRGKIDIDEHPAIRDWLLPFKKDLEKRATKQEWFELQQAQVAYQQAFEKPKIVYQDITATNPFTLDQKGFYAANTCYFISSDDPALLSFLNSRLAWFFLSSVTNIARGGYLRLRTEFVERLPLPTFRKPEQAKLTKLGYVCTHSAASRLDIQTSVSHRILSDLAPSDHAKLSRKLEEWWTLDFAAFRAEVKRVFRSEIPVKERGEWETYLAKEGAKVRKLDAEIGQAEREIDTIVYKLFDLTPDEIALLEASLAGQY